MNTTMKLTLNTIYSSDFKRCDIIYILSTFIKI